MMVRVEKHQQSKLENMIKITNIRDSISYPLLLLLYSKNIRDKNGYIQLNNLKKFENFLEL